MGNDVPKLRVEGPIPFTRSNSFKELEDRNSESESCASAECPRNKFADRSGQDGSLGAVDYRAASSGIEDAFKKGVRERSATPAGCLGSQRDIPRPAHPSNRLVAQLNASWRVVDDPLQWVLQHKNGNPRSKNSGWRTARSVPLAQHCCAASAS